MVAESVGVGVRGGVIVEVTVMVTDALSPSVSVCVAELVGDGVGGGVIVLVAVVSDEPEGVMERAAVIEVVGVTSLVLVALRLAVGVGVGGGVTVLVNVADTVCEWLSSFVWLRVGDRLSSDVRDGVLDSVCDERSSVSVMVIEAAEVLVRVGVGGGLIDGVSEVDCDCEKLSGCVSV